MLAASSRFPCFFRAVTISHELPASIVLSESVGFFLGDVFSDLLRLAAVNSRKSIRFADVAGPDEQQCVIRQRTVWIALGRFQQCRPSQLGLTQLQIDFSDLKQRVVGQMTLRPILRHLAIFDNRFHWIRQLHSHDRCHLELCVESLPLPRFVDHSLVSVENFQHFDPSRGFSHTSIFRIRLLERRIRPHGFLPET